MRAALLSAAVLVAPIAPLAAQDAAEQAAAAPEQVSAAGPISLVTVSESVISWGRAVPGPTSLAGSEWRDETFCLEEGEEALFASDRVTFLLVGEGCFKIGESEDAAFEDEQRALAQQALEEARLAFSEAERSGDTAAKEAAFARYAEAARNAPDEEWVDDIERDRAAAIAERERAERERAAPPAASSRPPGRTRTGAVRGRPQTPPRPVIFRIASGSPAVLARVPRGTLVQRSTALCLKAGEQVSVAASNGQSVSYTGPGCLKRQARPTRDNIGGFTFG